MAVSAEDLDVLNTASQRLAGMLSPEAGREVLQQGIELLAELIGARYAAIGLVDESGVPVDFVYTGIDSGAAAGIGRLPRGDGLLGTVVDRHAALRVDELGADPRAAGFPAGHPPMSSLLAVPVVHQDRVFGRVYLCDKRDGRPFTARDEQLAGQFATTLGLVLSHKYLSERHRAHRELAEAFAGAWAGLMGEALLQKAVAALLENLDVDLAFVGEIDPAAPDSVNMRAICNRRGPGTPVTYRLSGSPCEGVVQSKAYCVVAADVAHRYPAHLLGRGLLRRAHQPQEERRHLLRREVHHPADRRIREDHPFRLDRARHHRTRPRRGAAQSPRVLRHPDQPPQPAPAGRPAAPADDRDPPPRAPARRDLPGPGSVQGHQRHTRPRCRRCPAPGAKERGRGSFHVYSEELNRRATLRFELENAMRHALEKDEFRIHYQAQVDPHSGRIVGMEALASWERPGIGLVSPLDFIPLAEETGFIVPLGEWILRTACAQMVQWQRAGHPGLRLAVNISARSNIRISSRASPRP